MELERAALAQTVPKTKREETMGHREPVTMRRGEGEALNVMGAQVRFLCGAEKTGEAWSLMEVVLPKDSGPPPHHHPWDEAYYVVEGRLSFEIAGSVMDA